jgi:hypothetical protein
VLGVDKGRAAPKRRRNLLALQQLIGTFHQENQQVKGKFLQPDRLAGTGQKAFRGIQFKIVESRDQDASLALLALVAQIPKKQLA